MSVVWFLQVICFVVVTEAANGYRRQNSQKNYNNRNGAPPVVCNPGDRLKRNPNDCKSFYSCSNGTPILMKCGDGTEFSEQAQNCLWPNEANCRLGPQGETSQSNTGYGNGNGSSPAVNWSQSPSQSRPGGGTASKPSNGGTSYNQGKKPDGASFSDYIDPNDKNFFLDMVFVDF